jgi:serine/threonine protein kinase
MDEVHKSHNLHNDISPENILLHFPADKSRVYIGICDWDMTTKSMELMKSLYAFTDKNSKIEELAKRWWVDPRVAYVHKVDADVDVRINRENMSEDYHKLQRGGINSRDLPLNDLAGVFHVYLNHICNNGRDTAGGLSHIITRFMGEHKWPIPFEHFRTVY